MDLKITRGWLRGFFDGEGHIQFLRKEDGHKQSVCRLYVGNTDQSLIEACKEALELLKIDYRVYVYGRKPPRKVLTTIYISRHDSILRYAKLVGFSSAHKTETLSAVTDYIARSREPKYSAALMRDLYIKQKMSLPGITRHFGKHPKQQWYFSRLLRDYGIPTRMQSDAIKIALKKRRKAKASSLQ